MANHKSAKKRARQSVKRAARNRAARTRVKSIVKEFRAVLGGGDAAAIRAACNKACREVRKAASHGILSKETASRRVSRLCIAANSAL